MRLVTGQRDKRTTITAGTLTMLTDRLGGREQSRDVDELDGDIYMQWGFKRTQGLQYAIDTGLPFIIVDWGYFGDRGRHISISFNGFHGASMPVHAAQLLDTRPHPHAKPWKEGGKYVYVYGQLQNDRAIRGLEIEPWLRRTAQAAAEAFGKPAKIRPHPLMICSWEKALPPIQDTFDETYAAVVYTSSAAVQSVLAGVPTISLHKACPADPVCAHDFKIVTPNRTEWLHDLSWRNYSMSELDNAAKYIIMGYDQAVDEAQLGIYDIEGLRV